MATLYVTEYARVAHDGAGQAVITGLEPARRTQLVSIGGTSAATPLPIAGLFVRLHTDAACCVKFGASGVEATTSDARLAANQTEFFGVLGNATTYVAVIASA